jgi:hypothetical protein
MDRKRELDVTKERMDGLVEKLYVGAQALAHLGAWLHTHSHHLRAGREKGLELRGAIDSHLERYRQQAPAASAEPPPPPPSAAKADVGAGSAETPPAAQQAKPRKTTPEASAGRGYASLSRGKTQTKT